MWRYMTISGALACAAQVASGQVGGEATWLWEVTTLDGDAIVEPGETAVVNLSIDFEPDADQDGPVFGLGAAVWDTLGGANARLGGIVEWEVPGELTYLTGDLTTTDGVSLFGTTVGQLPIVPAFVHDDPVHVLTFHWSTDTFGEYVVKYDTFTYLEGIGEHVIIVWEGENLETAEDFIWPINETTISFQVVPAPGCLSTLSLAAIVCGRRRRA